MSLRVWLPFDGNLNNNGITDISLTNNGVTTNDSGKIGKCYSFNGSSNYLSTTNYANFGSSFTVCMWVNFSSVANSKILICTRSATYGGFMMVLSGGKMIIDPTAKSYSSSTRWTTSFQPTTNTWYHLAVTRTPTECVFYVNGETYESKIIEYADSYGSTLTIGCRNVNGSSIADYFSGKLNDLRIYDHTLSAKEIKEISKGIIVHYKFDDRYNTNNLILNGYGEEGTVNWQTPANMSTTDIPSGETDIKASYWSNMINEYIPINVNDTYTISTYVKSAGATTGNCYPNFYPYDYDKYFIDNFKCADGFVSATRTTLAQPLKNGDTVIHATDLSAWTTTTYRYYCAIFGYKDSSGRVYDDWTYTHDAPAFYANNTWYIDKTTNTITLLSPFSGEDRPAGTSICQSTAGSTYFYPFGAIPFADIQTWVYKTATLKPASYNRLKYAKYIRFNTYPGVSCAGVKLVDNTYNNANGNCVYDVSGYGRYADRTGSVTTSDNSPRNRFSMKFVDGSYITNLVNLPSDVITNSYTYSWWGKYTYVNNKMMWGYSGGNRLNLYMSSSKFYWNTGDGGNNPFSAGSSQTYGDNQWHHFCVTGDGTTVKLYIDGTLIGTATTYKGPAVGNTKIYFNGWDSGNNYDFNGYLSDFRLYATALSESDVIQLYNTPISIGNTGAVITCAEFVEE